uniref:B30.2/SPRY domain-containing protein n=1 Tax=Cyprinus carpio TaxID=7962 RepID=A0A8C2D3M9_CYPCA
MENRESSERSSSADHSCVSLKSDKSNGLPSDLSDDPVTSDPRIFRVRMRTRKRKRSSSPDPSCVSLKSGRSMQYDPPKFNNELVTSDPSMAHGGEIRMTAGPRKWACDLTLDPNTAHTRLVLSDESRRITHVYEHQQYPDHPERFDDVPQVLCVETLTGRCYWEAEWSGDNADISVSYKGISRKGVREGCMFGWNDKSWSLDCSDDRFTVWHNNNSTEIPADGSSSKRAGVYVDVSAGSLSFYSVSDTHTLTHLHTFNTTFTEPLCAGFTVYYDSSVSLCDIKQ